MKKKFITGIMMFMSLCVISGVYAANIIISAHSNEDVINRGYQNNITKFYTEKDFNGSASITRAQATKMFMSWLDMHKDLTEKLPQSVCTIFIDDTQIDSSLKTQVYNACGYGILKGNKDKFMPNDFIPAEHATIALGRLKKIFPSLNDYFNSVVLKKNYIVKRIDLLRALYQLEQGIKGQLLTQEQQKLDTAKVLWAKNMSKNYMITQTVSCFCMGDYTRPITYQINNGGVVSGSAMYSDMSGGKVLSDMYTNLNTVESAFNIIEDAINNKAESVQVKYDAVLGYPTSIAIDMSKMIADEERYITFSIKK